jgi:hypothetical protein
MPLVDSEDAGPRMITEEAKEYLAEERFRIKLHELVAGELRRVLVATADDYFPPSGQWSPDEFEKRLNRYESSLAELLRVQALMGYWGEPYQHSVLKLPTTRLGQRLKLTGGLGVWLYLRWYPVLLLFYSGGIAAVAAGKYDNLRELMFSPVSDKETTHGLDIKLIRVVAKEIKNLIDSFKSLSGHGKHYTPISEYLLKLLQPMLEETLFLGTGYEDTFDRFELFYALQHVHEELREGGSTWGPVGRFGWKQRYGNPIKRLQEEAAKEGGSWGPLRAGLFGGSIERFNEVASAYSDVVSGLHWY